jgi:hypothetical protein
MTTLTTIPDSELARAADAFAASVEPAFLVNHSRRTFHLGTELLSRAGRTADAELLYVASILHDVALGTELDDGVTPFQLRGGEVAANWTLEAGRSDRDASLIYDAIALHLELTTAQDGRPEVAGVHLGAAADVIGLRVEQLSPAWLEVLLGDLPRLDMKTAVVELLETEARTKPYSRAAALIDEPGFFDLIKAAPFDS